ncbi:MAG TPA: ABC-type transport auxiliary lipoprotein family protein [Nitrosospira sp.]|nr:ABC-type transport auxiliary lipoprotein family protein [Nitrosospira sp.]
MKNILALAMGIVALAGCAAVRTHSPAAVYDFGLQRPAYTSSSGEESGNKRLQVSLLVADVSVPVSRDNTGIHYRLAYDDPARSYAYGSSRWAAPPAVLLTQRVRSRIAEISENAVVGTTEGVLTNYALRLEIEEFSQVFDTADDSRAIIKLRAGLIDRPARLMVAQRNFSMEQAAPTPNAAGATHALAEASDKLIEELIGWIIDELTSERRATPDMGEIFSTYD